MIAAFLHDRWKFIVAICVIVIVLIGLQIRKPEEMVDTEKFATPTVTPSSISSQKAIDIVRDLPEVAKYRESVKDNAQIEVDSETDESWKVHVYAVQEYPEDEDIPSHTATFNWYSVNKNTGKVDCSFFIYKDGQLERSSEANEYPCHE